MNIYENVFGISRQASSYAKKNLYYCDRAGYIKSSPDFIISRDFMDDYLIVYVVSGIFHIYEGANQIALTAGKTAIVNLKKKHLYFSDKNRPCEILWVDFNCKNDNMQMLLDVGEFPFVFLNDSNFSLMNHFVYQYVNNILFNEAMQSSVIYQILISAVCSFKDDENNISSQFYEVENFINSNINRQIGLSELAGIMKIGTSHFSHLFKQKYGLSPMKLVTQKKMDRAMHLLTYSNLSITQIAEQLGYYNQSHFSASFKRNVGVFPSVYRK